MKIGEVIKEFGEGKKIKLIPVTVTSNKCPYCNEEILKSSLKNGNITFDIWSNIDGKGYTYNDGDTIPGIEKGIELTEKQYDAQLLQGGCRKCNEQYVGIGIDIANIPITEQSKPMNEFYIDDDSILYDNNVKYELLSICINEKKIGTLTVYKNVNYSVNTIRDIYRIELGAFELESDLRGKHGVACCSLTQEKHNVWVDAKILSQFIINDFVENSGYNTTLKLE